MFKHLAQKFAMDDRAFRDEVSTTLELHTSAAFFYATAEDTSPSQDVSLVTVLPSGWLNNTTTPRRSPRNPGPVSKSR